jgi:hypothetical protein
MAEQTTLPGDEGQQPEAAVGGQPSGQPSQAPPGWSAPAEYGTPGMAGPGDAAGPPEQAPAPGQLGEPGQPGEPGQVADVTALEAGSPPTRSRRRMVIVIAAAAVVLIAGGTVLGVVLSSGSSGQAFPSTLLGLTRDTSPDAQQVAGQISSELGVLSGLIANPGAAVYGTGPPNQGVLVMTGQWSDAAKADGLISDTPTQAIDGLKSQGVTDATVYPGGPRGGNLACGDTTIAGAASVVCAWTDDKMFGVTFYLGVTSSLSDAASKTIQVRSAVEH